MRVKKSNGHAITEHIYMPGTLLFVFIPFNLHKDSWVTAVIIIIPIL